MIAAPTDLGTVRCGVRVITDAVREIEDILTEQPISLPPDLTERLYQLSVRLENIASEGTLEETEAPD